MANEEYRIGQLEKDVVAIKLDLKKILENHLPHLDAAIAKLEVRATIAWGIIMLVLAGIAAKLLTS